MTRNKAHATEEHRDGRMEARERRHSSTKDARSSGEQAEAAGQEIGRSKVHANEESVNDRGNAWRALGLSAGRVYWGSPGCRSFRILALASSSDPRTKWLHATSLPYVRGISTSASSFCSRVSPVNPSSFTCQSAIFVGNEGDGERISSAVANADLGMSR